MFSTLSQFVLNLMWGCAVVCAVTIHNDCAKWQLALHDLRMSVMAIDSKCKAVKFCKQQNLGTQVFSNWVCDVEQSTYT